MHCEICELLADEPAEGWILHEEGFTAMVFPGHEVPGSIVCVIDRHATGITELTEEEAARWGRVTRRLTRALRTAMNTERVYLAAFGETIPHFHFLAAARTDDIDPDLRGPGFVLAKDQMRDIEGSKLIAKAVREALAADT